MLAESESLTFDPINDLKEKMLGESKTLYITEAIRWCQGNFTIMFEVIYRLGEY